MNTTLSPVPPALDWYGPISDDLAAVERVLNEALVNKRPGLDRILRHLEHYRGKRLRPALLLLTARACGKVTPHHHTLGAVVEMIHTATLVHDDVLDEAEVRRHVATVNATWGNETSILLGDYLFTHAFHLASMVDARACRLIGEATNRVCEGELHQVNEKGNLDLTEEEYFDMIDGKTAALTACSCRLGAIYSGATEETVEALTRYGRYLGLAFQIADDVLDLVGEEDCTGKSLGTDLEQQKLTLPLIRLLRSGGRDESRQLRQLLNAPGNHKRAAIAGQLAASDAIRYAQERALELTRQAVAELAGLPVSRCRTILEQLAERVVHRSA